MRTDFTKGPWHTSGEQVWNKVEAIFIPAPNFDLTSPSQELMANARLVSKAPEMFALMEKYADVFNRYGAHHLANGSQEKAQANFVMAAECNNILNEVTRT